MSGAACSPAAAPPPDPAAVRGRIADDLRRVGVRSGCPVLVHSSLSSLTTPRPPTVAGGGSGAGGDFPSHVPGGAGTVIDALLEVVGPNGTLCFPSLSYLFTTADKPVFDVLNTPTNLGAIAETFRRRPGVVRSLHPTHSVCAIGPQAELVVGDHHLDSTPVGTNSAFRKIRDLGGQVVFLGCGARCNTSMHGVEETLSPVPPYLLQPGTVEYTVVDRGGNRTTARHSRHNFEGTGQRYERLVNRMLKMPPGPTGHAPATVGYVMAAETIVYDAETMWSAAAAAYAEDPLCFVEPSPEGEDHFLKQSATTGLWSYVVGPKGSQQPAKPSETGVLQAPVPPLAGRDSYVGPDIPSVRFRTGTASKQPELTLVWLPGAGQRCDNELLRRLVNALHAVDTSAYIVGVRSEREVATALQASGPTTKVAIGGHSKGGGTKVVIGGHSKGGGTAARLFSQTTAGGRGAGVRGLVALNAAIPPGSLKLVPRGEGRSAGARSLYIFGETDPGMSHFPAQQAKGLFAGANKDAYTRAFDSSNNTRIVIARAGDHSIRFNGGTTDEDKERASTSVETITMNTAVARDLKNLSIWPGLVASGLD